MKSYYNGICDGKFIKGGCEQIEASYKDKTVSNGDGEGLCKLT